MVERIIDFSARNRVLVLLGTAAAILVALWCIRRMPLDAIPDLSDTQVIVFSRWDRSPDIIEDQVTYPIVTALLGTPKVKAVRAFSDFGYSYVYVIFQDGTDLYWARSRVLEYLSKIVPRLPPGVETELGPDATSVGWVFQYALVDTTGQHDLARLRSLQDWYLRYHLQAVPGVAEVAAVGGFVKQYQVTVDPNRLLAFGVPLTDVIDAVRKGNVETGGRLLEFAGAEYMVRGRGYVQSLADIENIVVKATPKTGTPVLVRQVAQVAIGPDIRRGVADLEGDGDVVGGIVVMRQGENALAVIERVRAKLAELEPTLPPGVRLVTTYDRSGLIHRAIDTLLHALREEMVIVSLVILVFLWHVPSAIIPIITIPISVILAFIPLYLMGVTSNIMSLAGIAISIGVLVDGAIVEVENAYKRLEEWIEGGRQGDFHEVRLRALKEVGPAVFFSLLVIAVAFLPVFTLVDQEGRLFKPLAWSKNLAMAMAAVLAITLDPALRMSFARMDPFTFRPRFLAGMLNAVAVGRYYPEERHPISRILFAIYEPACRFVLRHRALTLVAALLLMASTVPVFLRLGSEFMPPLHEGAFLYMPTALPGMSVTEAQRILQQQDRILRSFPEVETRLRQGRPRHHAHRPGAVLDGRDHRRAEGRVRMASGAALVLRLSAAAAVALLPRRTRAHHVRGAAEGDGRGAAFPRHPEHLDDADPQPHRHAVDGSAHAHRHQGPRAGPDRHPAPRRTARGHPGRRAGNAQRRGGAHGRRLLPRLRPAPRGAGALRALGRRRPDHRHLGHRRRGGHHDRRRARALHGERALRPRVPRQRAGAASRARADALGDAGADGADRRHPHAGGAGDDPRRERTARRLRVRRHDRARRRRIRARKRRSGCRASSTCRRATRCSGAASTRTWPGYASGCGW